MNTEDMAPFAPLIITDGAALRELLPIQFGGVRSQRLFTAPDVTVSGIALDGDTVMREHIATVPFLLYMVDGRAIAHVGNDRIEMRPGTMVHVPAGVPLSVEALDPARIILSALLHHRTELHPQTASDQLPPPSAL